MDDLSRLNVSDETTPLGVFLVKSDSTEEKLLFRYPYVIEDPIPSIQLTKSKYALIIPQESPTNRANLISEQSSLLPAYTELSSSISADTNDQVEITKVIGLTDSAFSNLFGTVKHKLCDQKFELKVDNVRFVGHPTLVDKHCFHVVFALKANAQHDVVKSYHELSQHISILLKSEEKRCGYFSKQSKSMMACHDEIGNLLTNQNNENLNLKYQCSSSPYKLILERCHLAKELKDIFLQLSNDGLVNIKLNNWINLNFCLPQKVHRKLMASPMAPSITPANIKMCLKKLRPYHTFLLLIDMDVLLESLPQDVSPSFVRLIKVSNPLKNLLELSADADITLSQVFNIVSQLVYWGKATIIFPLCESNNYMLHPSASTALDSRFIAEFKEKFPGDSLLKIMSKFSLGVSLSQFKNPMNSTDQESKFVQMIVWMLRKHLLLQLHMYVLFVPLQNESSKAKRSFKQHNQANFFIDNPLGSMVEINEESATNSSCHSDVSLANSPENISLIPMEIINEMNENSPSINENELVQMEKVNDTSMKSTIQSSELILRDAGLTPREINEILSTPSADNLDDIRMFAKLVPYFDGDHHIEDIMYYENLRRSYILTLIDKFRDVLIICHYEDTAVTELLPYNTLQ